MNENLSELNEKLNNFYMPGVILVEYDTLYELEDKLVLGFGLEVIENYSKLENKVAVLISHSGVLKFSKPNCIWIESTSKIYIPVKGDKIIGKIVKKSGDYYQVEFGGPCCAQLYYLNFQEATKNNRPNVKIGDVIYCEFLLAGRGIEPEVTCVNEIGKSIGMGIVDHNEDSIYQVDLPTARKLLNIESFPFCKKIGTGILPHEIIIGSNGWIWLSAKSSREYVTLINSISLASHVNNSHIKQLIKTIRRGMFCNDK